jgi:hypothetical protein
MGGGKIKREVGLQKSWDLERVKKLLIFDNLQYFGDIIIGNDINNMVDNIPMEETTDFNSLIGEKSELETNQTFVFESKY